MKILEAKTELERHRGRSDIRLDEMLEIANHLISMVVPEQPSDRVAETLNERSLRYYISEGLIDRPLGKEGTAALYGYRHLVQALIVKALQGAYLPIKRIKEILAGKDDWELEGILPCQTLEIGRGDHGDTWPLDAMLAESQGMDIHVARKKALRYLDYLDGSTQPPVPNDELDTPPFLRFLRQESKSVAHKVRFSLRSEPRYNEIPTSDSWERFSLEDGIELHVRSDRVEGLRSSEIKRVLERLLKLLKTRK